MRDSADFRSVTSEYVRVAIGDVQVRSRRVAAASGSAVRADNPNPALPCRAAREVPQQYVALVDQTVPDSRNPDEDVQERARFRDQLVMLGCRQIRVRRDLLARGSDGVIRLARDLPKPAGEERSDGEKNQQEDG